TRTISCPSFPGLIRIGSVGILTLTDPACFCPSLVCPVVPPTPTIRSARPRPAHFPPIHLYCRVACMTHEDCLERGREVSRLEACVTPCTPPSLAPVL